MKKLLLFLAFVISQNVFAQTKKIDSVAILILDRMSDVIGDLSSCSYNLSSSADVSYENHKLIKEFTDHEVLIMGSNKMLVHSKGNKNHQGYWYNGNHVVYYSYTENNYAIMDAPSTIVATIDSLNKKYDIDFPAADFFYPAFTDDLIDDFETVSFLGNKKINGRDCFHILADNALINMQIWISNDELTLPVKFVIIYKNRDHAQYEATFSNWYLNPQLPDAIFEFIHPPGARKIAILPKYIN